MIRSLMFHVNSKKSSIWRSNFVMIVQILRNCCSTYRRLANKFSIDGATCEELFRNRAERAHEKLMDNKG